MEALFERHVRDERPASMADRTDYMDFSTARLALGPELMPEKPPIPFFYLYGEPHKVVNDSFIHIESLAARSRPSNWTIRPHVHRDLSHIICMTTGGGEMLAEETSVLFKAPCLLQIPASIVHGFRWAPESQGSVITIANSHLNEVIRREPALASLFERPTATTLGEQDLIMIEEAVVEMSKELSWAAPGHQTAAETALMRVMLRALRLSVQARREPQALASHYAIMVARFRERIEREFRKREDITIHASQLGVSPTALRVACRRIAGLSPIAMLDERTIIEARRLLRFSSLSVEQVGHAVGFEDPGYFSRFFKRHVGQSPRTYRSSLTRNEPNEGAVASVE